VAGSSVENSRRVVNDLRAMCRNPIRVTILDLISQDQVVRMPGILTAVEDTEITIDVIGLPPNLTQTKVTVEVLSGGELFWFHSRTQRIIGTGKLALDLPQGVQNSRRSHPRVDLEVPVRLLASGGRRCVTATLRDLSAGGASIQTETRLQQGERITLIFALGSGMFLRDLEMEVVRCHTGTQGLFVIGLRFHCDANQEAVLDLWVQKQLGNERSS